MRHCNSIGRLATLMLILMVCTMGWADNVVSLASYRDVPGAEVMVGVSLQNTDDVSGMQLEVPLPDALEYVAGSVALDSSRGKGHSVSASVVNSVLKVVVYSLNKSPLLGNSGQLLTFRLRLGAVPAVYPIKPTVVLVDNRNNPLSCRVDAGEITILAPQLSVSCDSISFGRVPLFGNYVREVTVTNSGTSTMQVSSIDFSHADLSADISSSSFPVTLEAGASRKVTVRYTPTRRGSQCDTMRIHSDAVRSGLGDASLRKNVSVSVNIKSEPYAVNELHTGSASGVSDADVTVALRLNNMDAINGFQCKYRLPDALEYVKGSISLANERRHDHRVTASVNGDVLTIIVYSATGSALKGNDGDLLSFRLHLKGASGAYTLHPEEVVMGMKGGMNVVSASYDGEVRIESPHFSGADAVELSAASLVEGADGAYVIHNDSPLPLTVTAISFTDEHFSAQETFPLTVAPQTEYAVRIRCASDMAGDYSTTMNVYTNDPEQRVKIVSVTASLYEPNSLSVGQVGADGDGCEIAVSMENYSGIMGMQFDIHLNGMSVQDIKVAPCSRMDGFSYSLKPLEEGWRLLVYSLEKGRMFAGKQGEMMHLLCRGAVKTAESPCITIDGIILTDKNLVNKVSHDGQITCDITLSGAATDKLGDVNGDGEVNDLDMLLLTDRLLSKPMPSAFDEDAADMNRDGSINAQDLTILTNKIRNKNNSK